MTLPSRDPNRRLVNLKAKALEHLSRLTEEWRGRVLDAIEAIKENPAQPNGNPAMLYRLGDEPDPPALWFAEFDGDVTITYRVVESGTSVGETIVVYDISVG